MKIKTFKLNVGCSIKQTNSNVCFRLENVAVNTNESSSESNIFSFFSISTLENEESK